MSQTSSAFTTYTEQLDSVYKTQFTGLPERINSQFTTLELADQDLKSGSLDSIPYTESQFILYLTRIRIMVILCMVILLIGYIFVDFPIQGFIQTNIE